MEIGSDNPVDLAMMNIEDQNFPNEQLLDCLKVIRTLLNNIADNPNEEKYRKLNKANEKLKERLYAFKGVDHFLDIVGFASLDDSYVFLMDNQNLKRLENALKILTNRINNFKIGKLLKDNPAYPIIKKRLDELQEQKERKAELLKAIEKNKVDVWNSKSWNPDKYFPDQEKGNQEQQQNQQ